MKNKIYLLLILLATAGLAPAVNAVNDAGDDDKAATPETVIVPFDVTKPIEGQKLDKVYIRYERFLELWQAAKDNKRGLPPEAMDQSFVLSSARYDAKLNDGALHVTGVIDLQTFDDDWVSVPLGFKDVKLGVLKLDGQPAPLADAGVAIEKAGHHRIEVEFDIPVGSDKTHISWGIPKTAGTLFSIALPDKQMKASVQPGNGVVERINGDQKIVTAALGSTDHVDLQLDSSVGLSTITQAAVAKIDTTLHITPAVELVHSGFEFSFPESQQDHFTVTLDKALALVKLDVPNLKSWKLTVGNDSQSLEITLVEPASGSFNFSIDAERSLTEHQRKFPFISAAANRIEQTSVLFSTAFLDVTPQPTDALRQISYPDEQNTGLRLVAAFSSTGDKELLAYGVQPAKLSNKAEISYVYLVNHSKIELVAALKLQVKNSTLFDVTVGLPGDFVVQAVESGRLKDWWREGDVLHVRFKGNAPGAETPLVLHLVKLYKAVPDALEIKPLTLPDTWDVDGNGIIAASSSVQAKMTLAGAKEINPQYAATDFRILPPMERKRGFSFKGQDFHASVTLETLPPRVDGTWVMSAQAHESWVSVSTHVNLSARQGSAPGVSFRLPASVPEARVTGDNVRETTSAVEGDWRVYHVAFQNDLTDQTGFAVDFELPGDGNVSLPPFEFLPAEVERTEGFVIVDNASEYVMDVKPSGMDVALSEQIPYLPQVSRNASLFRAQPGWTLQINLTRLEKEAGRSALVEWAELTTAIRADGSEWHRATYHLQNRSLQFLPVKLPRGSELASVNVAGENVRADRGQVDGKDVLLVPLIKTKPGDASYDVNLVYRKKGGSLWTFSHETLADPEVVGITVERTLWNLYVPEGSDAGHFGGNMEQVLDEVNQTEKLEGMLDELKRLNSIVYNGGDTSTIQNAGQNFEKLAKTVEENSKNIVSNRVVTAATGNVFQAQSSDVAAKKDEIQKELEEQKKSYQGNVSMAKARNSLPKTGIAKDDGLKTQTWANNSSYVNPEEKQEGKAGEIDQKSQQGNQLYVNDYVVNFSGSNTYSGTTVLNGANTYTGGTTIAAGATLSLGNGTVEGTTGVTTVNGGGLLVQNQISQIQSQQALQRQSQPGARVVLEPEKINLPPPTGGGQITSGLRSGGVAYQTQLSNGVALDNMASTTAVSGTLSNAGSNVIVLEAARANPDAANAAAAEQTQQAADQAEMNAAAASAAPASDLAMAQQDFVSGAGGLAHGQGQGQGEGNQVSVESKFVDVAGGDNFGLEFDQTKVGAGTIQQGPAQLQTAGAISLPIDFPIDGLHVYHFKKLKGNATLSFWITNGQSLDRWKWLVVFLVVAALMKAAFMIIDRGYLRVGYIRVLRRRIVHI